MNLIGINGFKTSGKDTAFGFVKELAEADAETAKRLAFADKLKVLGGLALGFEFEDGVEMREPGTGPLDVESHVANMDDFKETGKMELTWSFYATGIIDGEESVTTNITGRSYLQNLGAQARRVFGDTFWIDQVLPNPGDYDGDDWEQQLESELWSRVGDVDWVCVTDVRYANEAQRVLDLGGEVWEIQRPGLESDGHSSETPLPAELVTLTITNDGTLDDLKLRIADAMGTFGRKTA